MTTGNSDRMRLEQSMVFLLRNLGIIESSDAMLLLSIVLRHFYDDYTEED
jgi:hypothetical protein